MKTTKLPKFDLRAGFVPNTIKSEERTVELTWSTGARVLRGFWESYWEELSMDPKHIRMERLNGGAPLLNSHNAYDLENQIGVVERAWVEGGEGRATVRFSKNNEKAEKIWKDVEDGIIRNVSVGYAIHRFEQIEGGDEKIPTYRATDWEPMELSLVAIPADVGAGVRNAAESFECTIIKREFPKGEKSMDPIKEVAVDVEAVKREAVETERKRALEIRDAVKKAGLDAAFGEELICKGVAADEARTAVINKLAERAPAVNPISPAITIVRDEVGTMREGMVEALLHRHDSRKNALTEKGRNFSGLTLREMAREALEARGINTRGMNVVQIAERSFHSTSDFPFILADVANKSLRAGYEESPSTYAPISREVEVSDFKEIKRNQLGDYPAFEKVLESGEFKRGSVSEAKEAYAVETFGKIVAISRQVIINDDMDAFTRIPTMAGARARALIADTVWALITSNPTMGDGIALFHASHGNLLTSGGAAIKDGLSGMRAAMRKQTGLDGLKLNLTPASLLVGVERETEAEQVVSGIVVPATVGEAQVFARTLSPIAESRLGAVPYYIAAAPSQVDVVEIAYLTGQRGVYSETRMGFDVDGVEFKARLDFGAKVIDWRGLVKQNGVV